MIKAIVFDMDGVLVDTEPLGRIYWNRILKARHYPPVDPIQQRIVGANRTEFKRVFLDYYGKDFPFDECYQEIRRCFEKDFSCRPVPLKPGAKEILQWLREKKKVLIGLCTSSEEAKTRRFLEGNGLLSFFDRLTCGDQIRKSKPDPDSYLTSCRRLGVRPAEAIAVEDSYNGVRSASSAGLLTIMVPDQLPPTDEMKEKAHIILPDLMAVQSWLDPVVEDR